MKDYNAPMHTVEHLLNGYITREITGVRAFSTHIERKKSKIDFHFDRDMTAEEIAMAESYVNRAIAEDLAVTEELVSLAEAAELYNISRLPDSAEEQVKIVHIGSHDSCPCIGEHVERTSEIESQLRIISSSHNPETGVLRVRFKLIAK